MARVRGTSIEFRDLEATAIPALTDPRIQRIIAGEARGLGLTTMAMPSGAGPDAQDIARIALIGMIFVPSVGRVIAHQPASFRHSAVRILSS